MPTPELVKQQKSALQENPAACAHCGLPVPAARRRLAKAHSFCCAGCESVYAILHESNLDGYYALRADLGNLITGPANVSGKEYRYFDEATFLAKFAEPRAEGRLSIRFYLEGVHCAACSWLVEKVLMERERAAYAHLDLGRSIVEIVFDPRVVTLSQLGRALDRVGYTPHPLHEDSIATARKKEGRSLLLRMGVAGAVAGNIMLLAVALYAGDFTGIDPDQASLFRWVSFGLSLPVVIYSAMPFYKGAIGGLRGGMLHMDLPISLGILAAFAVSVLATLQNRGDVYYDSMALLIFLLLVGRLLLSRATARAADASETLMEQAPRTVRREVDGRIEEIALAAADVGDSLVFLPGDVVTVDGVALQSGWVTEAHLTGESAPVMHSAGDRIFAGSQVVTMPLKMQATAVGAFTRLAQLSEMMRRAATERAPIVRLHDRIAGYFVASVLSLAAITALIWWQADPSRALWNVAALLVVTCPCALGLATPVALSVAMGRAAKYGIFIKSSDALERAARVQHAILDKTGTLTSGRMELLQTVYAPELSRSEQEHVLTITAALERYSVHPIAAALQEVSTTTLAVEDVHVETQGISGLVGKSRVAIGSRRWIRESEIPLPTWASEVDANVFVARDGLVVAAFQVADPISPEADEAVKALHSLGIHVELLSGDRQGEVERVARALSLEQARGEATPEDKLTRVSELELLGVATAMFGDGVNDAAALSRATVGVSAAEAADVARSAADVFVSRRGPRAFAELVLVSRNTLFTIKRNVVIALSYNLIGAGLAMAGLVSPLLAAILMPISSVTVLTLAVRGSKP